MWVYLWLWTKAYQVLELVGEQRYPAFRHPKAEAVFQKDDYDCGRVCSLR